MTSTWKASRFLVVTGPTGDFTTAQGGTIHFNADGSYIYTPAANFNGIDSVSYVVQDAHGATATAALNIAVNAVNDAPVISGLQDVAVAEGQVGALIDTFTVSDVDTAAGLSFRVLDGIGNVDTRFTVVAVSGTTFGQPGTYELRLAPGQSLSFVAESADGNPTIVRTVEVNDQGGTNNIGTASITMTVEDANAAPTVTSATAIGAIVEDQSFGAPPQLINNGGFESWTYNSQTGTYTIPNWTFAGNFFYPPGVVGIEHSGGAALGVYTFNSGSGGTASETFATVAGQHYHMQFFLEKERAGAGNAFSASWNGETLVAIANQTTFGNYVQYDFDVVGADGASTLQFNFVSGVASYWFLDDVSVTPAYTPGVELRSGRIGFADADLTDSHTVAVRPDTSGYVGNFTWTLTNSTGTGAGRINWNFSVSDADIQYLGPSSTLTQTYHVVINDGHGGSVTQDVTVAVRRRQRYADRKPDHRWRADGEPDPDRHEHAGGCGRPRHAALSMAAQRRRRLDQCRQRPGELCARRRRHRPRDARGRILCRRRRHVGNGRQCPYRRHRQRQQRADRHVRDRQSGRPGRRRQRRL